MASHTSAKPTHEQPENSANANDDGAESDETFSMQTTDMEWYRVLSELRSAFEQQL